MDFRYFSALSGSNRLGRVLQAGRIVKQTVQPKRVLDHFALVLIERGSGFFASRDCSRRRVQTGDVLVLFPGVWHSYGPESNDYWQELFFVFEGPVFDLWQKYGWLNPASPVLHTEQAGQLSRRLEAAFSGGEIFDEATALLEVARLQAVLAELICGSDTLKLQPGDKAWRVMVEAALAADPEIRPEVLAKRLRISDRLFRQRFSRVFGESFGRRKTRQRIEKACRDLLDTNSPVRLIAERLGYCDEFYFSAAFKKATGHAPAAYRNRFRKGPD